MSGLVKNGGDYVPTAAGGVQHTYAEPRSRFVIGQEYLWMFHNAVLKSARGARLEVVFTGDSTTRGAHAQGAGGSLPSEYRVDKLSDAQLIRYGITGPVSINRGLDGFTTREWLNGTRVDGQGNQVGLDKDIALYPNMALYVIRLGLNDGSNSPGYHDIEQYRKDIRAGLQRLRNWRDVYSLSIVLMTPNSTSEPGFRDEAWNEQVAAILKQLAREFQCCFIDTYANWRDARGKAVGAWLDNVTGFGVHPDGVFNHWIMNLFGEVVYAPLAVRTVVTNNFINASGVATRAITSATTAASFDAGVSIYRTDTPNTFPIDGCVIITKTADGITKQENIGFLNDVAKKSVVRYALDGGAWSDWRGVEYPVALAAGCTKYDGATPDPSCRKSPDGTVFVSARVANPAAAIGTTLFTLPAGYRPLTNTRFLVHNWAGTVFGTVQVGNDGAVLYVSGDKADMTMNFAFNAFN